MLLSLRSLRILFGYSVFLVVHLSSPVVGRSDEIIAVLSSDLGPYQQAYQGFQEVFNRPIPLYKLNETQPRIDTDTRIVVAFGGKAAQWSYPDHVVLIYCMAPGTRLSLRERRGSFVEIQLVPEAAIVLDWFKKIQPGLKRLAVFWASKPMEDYVRKLEAVSQSTDIRVMNERLGSSKELPVLLRNLHGKIDAFWLLPDPPVVNSQSVSVMREYSLANSIPFFAPIAGLVEQGATASVSISFREIGRTAGRTAERILAREGVEETVYPKKVDVTLNLPAVKKVGLIISPEVRREADRVLP